jgi:hypothetical protein
MDREDQSQQIVEQGDIFFFFFYRPKVGTEQVSDIGDVQTFYMVTAPEGGKYRLFVIGQKQLPEIVESKSTSEERNWALNVLTASDPEEIRKERLPAEYATETRGKRRIAAAAPQEKASTQSSNMTITQRWLISWNCQQFPAQHRRNLK